MELKKRKLTRVSLCIHKHLLIGLCRSDKISFPVDMNQGTHFPFLFVQPCCFEKQWHYTLLNTFQTPKCLSVLTHYQNVLLW